MTRTWVAVLGLLGLAQGAQASTVPPERLEVLSRGANITYVYERKNDLSLDLGSLHAVGFRHVRVFIDEDDLRQPLYQRKLDQLVHQAVDRKLGIIVAMISRKHPWQDGSDVEPIWTKAWRDLATRYKAVSPRYLFLEIANEPSLTDGARWSAIQERLRETIRSQMPDHTVLLTGSPTSMVWTLPTPSADENVVYTWHLYQPMHFTHQGADWIPEFKPYAGLQYPPSAENVHNLTRPQTRDELAKYLAQGATMMPAEIEQSRKWADEHHAALLVDEFGVYSAAPVASRAAWLREAREKIEAAHEGWTVWEYQGGFGISPLLQHGPLLKALGLGK